MTRHTILGPKALAPLLVLGLFAASAHADGDPAEDRLEDDAASPTAPPAAKPATAKDTTEDTVAANNPTLAVGQDLSGGAIISLTQNVGQGTVVPFPRWNPYVMTQLDATAYVNVYGLIVFASESVTGEWTQPDSYGGSRLNLLGDPRLGAQYNFALPAGFILQPSAGVRLPVTRVSRAQGLVGAAFVGNNVIWQPVSGLLLRTGASVQVNAAVPQLRGFRGQADVETTLFRSSDRVASGSCLARAGESVAQACGAIPSLGQGVASLGASYTKWGFTGAASLSVLGLLSGYYAPKDQFTSDNAFVGFFPRVFTAGSMSLGYRFTSWFALSGGISSFQPWSMAGNNIPRLPMWDFVSPANNYSTVFVSTTFNL